MHILVPIIDTFERIMLAVGINECTMLIAAIALTLLALGIVQGLYSLLQWLGIME